MSRRVMSLYLHTLGRRRQRICVKNCVQLCKRKFDEIAQYGLFRVFYFRGVSGSKEGYFSKKVNGSSEKCPTYFRCLIYRSVYHTQNPTLGPLHTLGHTHTLALVPTYSVKMTKINIKMATKTGSWKNANRVSPFLQIPKTNISAKFQKMSQILNNFILIRWANEKI